MMKLIAGLDFGTSSVKLIVATAHGEIVARAQASYSSVNGQAGEAEQSAEDWWVAAAAVVAETKLGNRIDAIGITGQMQDLIPVAGDRALRPVLLYSDTRAVAQHSQLKVALPDWEQVSANHQDATNIPAKIAWLAEHEPAVINDAEHFLFGAPGYICWRATGVAACDLLTASTTGLLNIQSRDWYTAAINAAGAKTSQLPKLIGVTGNDSLIGVVQAAAAAWLGVRAGIPIIHAMGDAGSATDGLIGSEQGLAYIYLGTTAWLAAITTPETYTSPSPIHSLVMPGWASRLRIGAVQSAGATADWSRRSFLPGLEFDAVETLAAKRVEDPAALAVRPLALPGITGERTPVRDPDFRGAFVGIHAGTKPIDFHLAVLTGVALALRHVWDNLGISQQRIPIVGGGASSPAWRRILANVFNASVITGNAGDPGTHSALRTVVQTLDLSYELPPLFAADGNENKTEPSANQPRYEQMVRPHRALYDALAPIFHNSPEANQPIP